VLKTQSIKPLGASAALALTFVIFEVSCIHIMFMEICNTCKRVVSFTEVRLLCAGSIEKKNQQAVVDILCKMNFLPKHTVKNLHVQV
jgi:hypothetical protein